MSKLDKNFTLDEFVEYVNQNFKGYSLVKNSDFESEDNQTYKFLYEKKCAENNKLQEELFMAHSDLRSIEQDYSKVSAALETEKNMNFDLSSESRLFIDFIKEYLSKDVTVSDIAVYDSDNNKIESNNFNLSDPEELSDNPGVYDFKRPSWFSPLKNELNKRNVSAKNIKNTEGILSSRLSFLKKIISSKNNSKALSEEIDADRKKKIVQILLGPGSNQEKYLKYILTTPGLSKEYRQILLNASDLGINANVVIELFEQPKESFNKEIIEAFVSEVHKGTEYNLKQELAEELARGDWYISATVNGKKQKLTLVPFDEIQSIKERLESISNILSQSEDTTKSGSTDSIVPNESTEQEIQEEERFPYIYEDENEIQDSSSMINFDDSMI